MKRPTLKQIAARKRNWKIAQLKGACAILRGFIPRNLAPQLRDLEEAAKVAIDRRWKAELDEWTTES